MSPSDAAKLLDLPADATPDQLEARFNELRAKLEDKIAKAPTPGLKAKYRESLDEITTAFETLTLAADSSSLPVTSKQRTEDGGQRTAAPVGSPLQPSPGLRLTNAGGPSPSDSGLRTQVSGFPAAKRKSGSREFLVVAIIALIVLGVAGWFVMKTRAENAAALEVAKAAEALRVKNEADAVARADARKQQLTELRSRFAELNVRLDSLTRIEDIAGRTLDDLRAQEREATRAAGNNITPAVRKLSARLRAQDNFVSWLRTAIATHPAKVARAKIDEFLQAGAIEQAEPALSVYDSALLRFHREIEDARTAAIVVGTLRLEATIAGTTWKLVDALGAEVSGTTPAVVNDLALGQATVIFQRPRWPELRQRIEVRRDREETAQADYRPAKLTLTLTPVSASAVIEDGRRVDGTTWELDPGKHVIEVEHPDFAPQFVTVNVASGDTLAREIVLDQNLARSLVPLMLQRLKQMPPDYALFHATQIADYIGAPDLPALIHEVLALSLQEEFKEFNLVEANLPMRAVQLGLKSEAQAMVDWLDKLESNGLRNLPDNSFTDSLSLTWRLARLGAIRIAAGDRDGLDRYFDRIIASQTKHQGQYLPTRAHQESAIFGDVAMTLARLGDAEQASIWLERATQTGVSVRAMVHQVFNEARTEAALNAGDLQKTIAHLREAAKDQERLDSYSPYEIAIRRARQMEREDIVGAINALVTEFEAQGRFSEAAWKNIQSYVAEAFDHDYVGTRDKLRRERLELFKAARANPDPLKSLKALADLQRKHEYYRLNEPVK